MKRTLIQPNLDHFPTAFHTLLSHATVYDSSCSPEARVYYIEKDGGYYLKSAPKNSLAKEAALTRYLHTKQLATEVLAYESTDQDWFLTRRVAGEDCTHPIYLSDPKRLSETTGTLLRQLHDLSFTDCPIPQRTQDYLQTARTNYTVGSGDKSYLHPVFHHLSTDQVWQIVENGAPLLKTDTLLHGDYCLPNIMLDDWQFTGFIDLGNGGVGDRHIDLYWGLWTLQRNLNTTLYHDRFLDAYGRERVDPEVLKLVSCIESFG